MIGGIAMAFNLLIIIIKFRKKRFLNAIVDFILMSTILVISGNTITGVQIGMIASAIVSLYLLFFPFEEPDWDEIIKI